MRVSRHFSSCRAFPDLQRGFDHANQHKTERYPLNTADLDRSLGYSLRRAQLSTYQEFSAKMDSFDIRPSQYAVLMLIRANPGMKQSAISAALGIQKANFVSLLDKLEERGLTERRKVGGDRRSSALHLTIEGERFVAKLAASHLGLEKVLTARLGTKRSRELLVLLHEFCSKAPKGTA